MSNDQAYFLQQNSSLGEVAPADELLHPVPEHLRSNAAITETQYFGFCVPEAAIHGFCYLWHHPNLHLLSGGLAVHRGDKLSLPHSELYDYRTYMSDAALSNDLHAYRLENGYGVEVLEPLKRHRVTYDDPHRQNRVAVEFEGFIPPIMFGDGAHFEQPGRMTGELMLRGERYEIDCFTMRDRSWGKPRPEDSMPLPAVSWMQAVFGEDFSFCSTVLDHASGRGLAGTPLALPDEKTLSGGWLLRDGRLGRLVHATKKATREPSGLLSRLELAFTDEHGRTIEAVGVPVTSTTYNMWGNIFMGILLLRWDCDGRTAFGDCQDGLWTDHLMALAR